MACKHGFPAPSEMHWSGPRPPVCKDCEIERLRAENAALKEKSELWDDLVSWQKFNNDFRAGYAINRAKERVAKKRRARGEE